MRSRAAREHSETLARRLELLTTELNGARPTPYDLPAADWEEHTRIRSLADDEPRPGSAEPEAPLVPRPGRHAAHRRGTLLDVSGLVGRVGLQPAQVAIAAVVAAVALAITCWWVLRDDAGEPVAGPRPVAALVTPSTGPAGPAAAGATPSGEPTELVVDVTGKVRDPGIVVLPPGSRVVDAIDAAGGAKRGADLTGVNLARLLVDGEQVVVGVPPVPGVASSSAAAPGTAPGGLVNLNLAGVAELDELPGVGPVTAQAIVDWREENGGFRSVDQLLDVSGIGEVTLAELAPLVTL